MQFPCALFTETRRQLDNCLQVFVNAKAKQSFPILEVLAYFISRVHPHYGGSLRIPSLWCVSCVLFVSRRRSEEEKKKKKKEVIIFFSPPRTKRRIAVMPLSVSKVHFKILHRVDMFNRKTCGSCRAAFRQLILRGCTAQEIFCWGIIVAQ